MWLVAAIVLVSPTAHARNLHVLESPKNLPDQYLVRLNARISDQQKATAAWSIGCSSASPEEGLQVSVRGHVLRAWFADHQAAEARLEAADYGRGGRLRLLVRRQDHGVRVAVDGAQARQLLRLPPIRRGGRLAVDVDARSARYETPRVQTLEPIDFADGFMRAEAGLWRDTAQAFSLGEVSHPELSASPFRYNAERAGLALQGRNFWSDYHAAVSCRLQNLGESADEHALWSTPPFASPPGWLARPKIPADCPRTPARGVMGLAFYGDAANHYLLRWAGDIPRQVDDETINARHLQLVRVRGDETRVLDQKPLLPVAGQWYRLDVIVSGTRVVAGVDGHVLLEAEDDGLVSGGVGLYAAALEEGRHQAEFDDVRVLSLPALLRGRPLTAEHADAVLRRPRASAEVIQQFQQDRKMREWADPKAAWERIGDVHWYVTPLFGDVEVRCKPSVWALRRGLRLLMHAKRNNAARGYALKVREQRNRMELTLLRGGRPIASGRCPAAGGRAREIRLSLREGTLRASVAGKEVLQVRDSQPLGRGWVGIVSAYATPAGASVSSPSLLDDTFSAAPADWVAATGRWEVRSRWACSPEYSWFGGHSNQMAVLWSKRRIGGDLSLDLYVAAAMADRHYPFYDGPLSYNVTLGADGQDLAGGFTFAYHGGDAPARVWHKGKVIAEEAGFMPRNIRAERVEDNVRHIHGRWEHLRVRRQGRKWTFEVEGREVCSFTEPAAPAGDRMAIWSQGHNPLMIARVRLSAAHLGARVLPDALPFALDVERSEVLSGATVHDAYVERFTQDGLTFQRMTNRACGGSFAALWPLQFDAAMHPVLRARLRMHRGAKVNLYVRAGDAWRRVQLNGGRSEAVGVLPLTRVEMKDDGQWHDLQVNLGQLLAAQGLVARAGERLLPVDGVLIGNLESNRPLQAGLTGNGYGAQVDVASLGCRDGQPVAAKPLPQHSREPSADELIPARSFDRTDDLLRVESGVDGALVCRNPQSPDGNGCLRAVAPAMGCDFGLVLHEGLLDARRIGTLSFDYRASSRLRIALLADTRAGQKVVALSDGEDQHPIGTVAVTRDGAWHHLEIPLGRFLRQCAPDPNVPLIVQRLVLSDVDSLANMTGAMLELDNVRLTRRRDAPARGEAGTCRARLAFLGQEGAPSFASWTFAYGRPEHGPDWQTLAVTVDDVRLGSDDPRLHIDPQGRKVLVDLRRLDAVPRTPREHRLVLQAQTQQQQPVLGQTTRTYTLRPDRDVTPPPAPKVVLVPQTDGKLEDFEQGLGDASNRRGTRARHVLYRQGTNQAAAEGHGFARIRRRSEGFFSAYLWRRPVRIEATPLLSFDYRASPGLAVGLMLNAAGDNWGVQLTGEEAPFAGLGAIEGAVADGQWHHAELDLRELQFPNGRPPRIEHIGTRATRRPTFDHMLDIDNIVVRSARVRRFGVRAQKTVDATGIRGFGWTIDRQPATVPGPETLTEALAPLDLQPGTWYLHINQCDGAGNWGPVTHRRLVVER